MKRILSIFAIAFLFALTAEASDLLTPADFGLQMDRHHQIDLKKLPPNIIVGNFNGDCYPDIARFSGERVEVFFRQGNFFPSEPCLVKYFDKTITSIRTEGEIWVDWWDIMVTLSDGREERIQNSPGGLRIEPENHPFEKFTPPRYVSEVDFELVWQSEAKPWGMDRCAVGDIDNDNIIELVTWYKESHYADSAFILIYKSVGDDEYELFMEERFETEQDNDALSHILITDLDQNGQKELIYTYDRLYVWEFTSPGNYIMYEPGTYFFLAVADVKVCDVDQDSVLGLAIVLRNSGLEPPCYYNVLEFSGKNSTYFWMYPTAMIWQDWVDDRLAVGDFDNDGIEDIVSGNAAYVWGYDPVDIQYFRYDTTAAHNFSQHWLQTGVASSCATPVVEDLDNDGLNELFAGGLCNTGGSAFVYEGTGFEQGEVTWRDTTSLVFGPNESQYGFIDDDPTVISLVIYGISYGETTIYLNSYIDSQYTFIWQSAPICSVGCHNPYLVDIDQDVEMNILLAGLVIGSTPNYCLDFEEVSNAVFPSESEFDKGEISMFHCYPNPFNTGTMITYYLEAKSSVFLTIYDILGRKLYNYEENHAYAGVHQIFWDTEQYSSGIYFISLQTDYNRQVLKTLLLK